MGKKSKSKFTDIRLDSTCDSMLDAITTRYSTVLRTLSDDYNEETRFANFISNPKVDSGRLLSHHWSKIDTDWSDKHMLVINDTSSLKFSIRADREQMNFVGENTKQTGFDIHPSILVDSQTGGLHGLGGLNILPARYVYDEHERAEKKERNKQRWKLPFEEKERYKWFTSPSQAIALSPSAAQYTLVGDRESDIYELIARTSANNWDFLYRSKNDRSLSSSSQTLYKEIEAWTVQHHYEFEVSATQNRTAHLATVGVKYGKVSIKRPHYHRDKSLPESITIQVVVVEEIPESVLAGEQPVRWILLTSHPIDDIKDALQIIKWYTWRWVIEQLFRSLKTKGLNIEASEVETFHGLCNLTTLALIASIQIMQMVNARSGLTDQSIREVFFETEHQCLILLNEKIQNQTSAPTNPYNDNSLAFASWIIARLGGWKGRAKERPPGPITMCKGLIKFYNILEGMKLLI